jgi:hypothetical protein
MTTERLVEQWADPKWAGISIPYFHTEPAREAGRARFETLKAFAEQAKREWTGDDLGL